VGRWEPDARSRLEEAAFALFSEKGYGETTVAEIADRAGLTERTFFRHFADKREVLFGGAALLQELLVAAVHDAAPDAAPIEAVAAALDASARVFESRRQVAPVRQRIISQHAELRERELTKLASLSAAIAGALRDRGVQEPAASLTAEAGIAVLKVAFERWTAGHAQADLAELFRETMAGLRVATAG
jgi:AcrR family transcriptional regulator